MIGLEVVGPYVRRAHRLGDLARRARAVVHPTRSRGRWRRRRRAALARRLERVVERIGRAGGPAVGEHDQQHASSRVAPRWRRCSAASDALGQRCLAAGREFVEAVARHLDAGRRRHEHIGAAPRKPTSATRSRRWYASPSRPSTVPVAAAARSGAPIEPLRSTHSTTVGCCGLVRTVERRSSTSMPASGSSARRVSQRRGPSEGRRLPSGCTRRRRHRRPGRDGRGGPRHGGAGARRGRPSVHARSGGRAERCPDPGPRSSKVLCDAPARAPRTASPVDRTVRGGCGGRAPAARPGGDRRLGLVAAVEAGVAAAARHSMRSARSPSAPTCNASRDAASSTSSASAAPARRHRWRAAEQVAGLQLAGARRRRAGGARTRPDPRRSAARGPRRTARSGRAAAGAARPPRGSSSRRARSGPGGGARRRRARRRSRPTPRRRAARRRGGRRAG